MSDKATIAIVGIGGIFPGADTLDDFWKTIVSGTSQAREVDDERWILSPEDAYDAETAAPDKVYSTRGCFITDLPKLPKQGLDIDPELIESLDPANRLLLAAGHQAFYSAQIEKLDRAHVGLIIGNLALPSEKSSALSREYFGRMFEEKVLGKSTLDEAEATHPLNRYVAGLPGGVLAKALGLGGGSVTLDAACSSSLYAVKLAVDELQAGRADAMLAGGLSRPDCLYTQMGFSQLRALSPTGVCSPFDESGNGLVVGEGCGLFLLKRLDDAERDGDTIHAVIKGIGLSNDVGGSLLAPMSDGQLRAMRDAYTQADLRPQDMDHIECHATGTLLGDSTEVSSLKTLWGDEYQRGQCVLGSVKSNIGHLLTAAGSAALLKTIFAMKEQTLPPTANFNQANPAMNLAESPFTVLSESKDWPVRDANTPRRAAVSAFGFGGINAHIILEEHARTKAKSRSKKHPLKVAGTPDIAIVGMDASFGTWTSLRAFQERVLGGRPEDKPSNPTGWWGLEDSAWYRSQGLNHTPFKGFYADTVDMPQDMFRIPPKELEDMLPQQLLMLKVAARALIDSGISPKDSAKGDHDSIAEKTGVFIGIGLDLNSTNFSFRWDIINKARDWAEHLGLDLSEEELAVWTASLRDSVGKPLSANRTMGALGSIVASRIAREFRIGGPSYTVSCEENSSMRALEIAIRALQDGSLNQALVGGVDLNGDMRSVLATHHDRAFSTSGQCRPFDAQADGTVIGEGAGAVVLKRLEDAVRDGDRIYGVIKGIGSASGGGVDSLLPTELAYTTAIQRAYTDADVDVSTVGLIEASGSGIPEEDALESHVLSRLFKTNQNSLCHVSSVKADIGHAGAASGIASVIKSVLSLYQEILPPLRGIEDPREELELSGHRLYCSKQSQYWLRDHSDGPMRAGVSALSLDGNCSHVVLESYEHHNNEPRVQTERLQPLGLREEALFFVEANNVQALEVGLGRLRAFVEHTPEAAVELLARNWWHENREDNAKGLGVSFVSKNVSELMAQIDFTRPLLKDVEANQQDALSNQPVPPFVRDRVFFNSEPLGAKGKVAFVYPGSGNQYIRMGQDLSVQWPEILRNQHSETKSLSSQLQPNVFWNNDSTTELKENHKATLFGQVALGTAISDLVSSFGVRPNAVVGYSLGEMAGFFSMKAWTDRDEMFKRIEESTLFTEDLAGEYKAARSLWKVPSNTTVDWALGVIDRPAKVVRAALTDHKKVYNLIVNTLHECVVGGDPHAVEKLVKKLDCEFFPLHGVTTVHCEVAKEVQEPYRELHLLPTTPPRDVQFYSGAWGTAYNVTRESAADSVLAQALYGIDYPKVIESAYDDGARVFIEMGPGGSCSRMIGEILGDRPHVSRTVCKQGQAITTTVLRLLGQLLAERVPVDLSVLYGQEISIVDESLERSSSPMLSVPTGGEAIQVFMPDQLSQLDEHISEPTFIKPSVIPTEPVLAASVSSAEMPLPASSSDPLIQGWLETEAIKVQAHETYLRFTQQTTKALEEAIQFQLSLSQSMLEGGAIAPTLPASPSIAEPPTPIETAARPPYTGPPVAMTREQCMEYAVGSIGQSMGDEWGEIDAHPTRVRLPDEPLMLVDRIVSFHGEERLMTNGRVVTEHDVLPGSWYLDNGVMPTCIAVEAGQADLILSAYLGIDFITKGLAMYRLLDADVTFHRPLPRPGETIHFNIQIERFFQQGDTYLFKFFYDGTISGEPFITMRNGCAGFFTRKELDAGQGVVKTTLDLKPMSGVKPVDWLDLVPMAQETYSEEQVAALRKGDYATCFGSAFANLPIQNPMGLPDGKMRLVERISEIVPGGGRFGLGLIRGEMDIQPDDWFLTCHFVDDRVMPGTLMYECCLHTMRIYLMRMGWVGSSDTAVYEPVPGITGQLKCRGEVNESTDRVVYEITLKEIGYNPCPYAIADTMMYVDGKPAVEMNNLSLQMTGWTRESIEAMWGQRTSESAPTLARVPLFDYDRILAFSDGNPSDAFGENYKIFDNDRVIARLPRPPFQFLDRIVEIDAEQWAMKAGGTIVSEYDVPVDEWYFESNRQPTMPFSVLLEIALQPCGWLAAFMGSALTSDIDLHFRNLGGKATQVCQVPRDVGTLSVRVKSTGVSSSGGMIIQHYDYEVLAGMQTVYVGNTYFGYFSDEALSEQVGLSTVKLYEASDEERAATSPFRYPDSGTYPGEQMRMIDQVEIFAPRGGEHSLGFIQGTIDVDPSFWFFQAHFKQDPVWPGSLGVEAYLQLLKHVAIDRWAQTDAPVLETLAGGCEHSWVYRGQVIPKDKRVTVYVTITASDDTLQCLTADGYLCVDGRIIYQLNDFTIHLKPGT